MNVSVEQKGREMDELRVGLGLRGFSSLYKDRLTPAYPPGLSTDSPPPEGLASETPKLEKAPSLLCSPNTLKSF